MIECREICHNAKQHLPGEESTVDFKRPEGRGCDADKTREKKVSFMKKIKERKHNFSN